MAPSCDEAGVLGVLPGVVGLIQATEAIKVLLGRGETLVGRLLTYDALGMTFRDVQGAARPEVRGLRRRADHPRAVATSSGRATSSRRRALEPAATR